MLILFDLYDYRYFLFDVYIQVVLYVLNINILPICLFKHIYEKHITFTGTARRDPPRHGDFDAQILVKKGLM